MGGSQSKTERKLTVENENAIQVSQDVLNRIQDQLNNRPDSKSASTQPEPAPPQPQYAQQEYTQQQQDYAQQRQEYAQQEYFQTEKRKHDQAAEEVYWARRIENLKRAHEKINAGLEIEYQKTLKEANELFKRAENEKLSSKQPPCQDEKAKVLECYSTNPNKTLLCSVLVNQFNDCVCKSRISAVTAS